MLFETRSDVVTSIIVHSYSAGISTIVMLINQRKHVDLWLSHSLHVKIVIWICQ